MTDDLVTFERARQIVTDHYGPTWDEGTLWVAPWGLEDDLGYSMVFGAREWLVDGDVTYQRLDDEVTFVSKLDGKVTEGSMTDVQTFERVIAMREVGDADAES